MSGETGKVTIPSDKATSGDGKLSLGGRHPVDSARQAKLREAFDLKLPVSFAVAHAGCARSTVKRYYAMFRNGCAIPPQRADRPRLVSVWVAGDTWRRLQRQAASAAVKPPVMAARLLDDVLAVDIPALPLRWPPGNINHGRLRDDLTGRRFGMLVVDRLAPGRPHAPTRLWSPGQALATLPTAQQRRRG